MKNKGQHDIDIFKALFFDFFHEQVISVKKLSPHASLRQYYFLESAKHKAIAVYGPDRQENKAFIQTQKALKERGVRVPDFFIVDNSYYYYLQEYCGDRDLFSYLEDETNKTKILKKTLDLLISVQNEGSSNFDFSVCHPFQSFDHHEIAREFWAFQNKYLPHKGLHVDNDFFTEDKTKIENIIDEISKDDYVFMHRDFQSRNILVDQDDELVLIDFQGGRCGPRFYDLASFVYSPESPHAYQYKDLLVDYYREKTQDKKQRKDFIKYLLVLALIRLIHDMSVYSVLGFEQGNLFFQQQLPTAERYFKELLEQLEREYGIDLLKLKSVFL